VLDCVGTGEAAFVAEAVTGGTVNVVSETGLGAHAQINRLKARRKAGAVTCVLLFLAAMLSLPMGNQNCCLLCAVIIPFRAPAAMHETTPCATPRGPVFLVPPIDFP
jgi:hypothetical protein